MSIQFKDGLNNIAKIKGLNSTQIEIKVFGEYCELEANNIIFDIDTAIQFRKELQRQIMKAKQLEKEGGNG